MVRKAPQLAKLTRPRLHRAVARERLFALLDEACEHKPAICVVSPPGAGKTTLVASWLDARSIKGIWYQVDPGDADLATFFYYLGEAAKPFTRKGQRPLPALTPEYLKDVPRFTRRYFRELASRLKGPSTLVLDNYQEVASDESFHAVIADAIAELPEGVTLVVVSRADPPDSYSRLIANANVAFVHWEQLRFTLDEATALVETRGSLDAEALHTVYERTGGWAAGMVLALERFKEGVAGSEVEQATQEAVFGYFASQIFDRLPDQTQRFLMQTALLPQVRVDIAQRLTGSSESDRILEELYRKHFFTHRRLGVQPTYWYHALFLRFLHERAKATFSAEELRELLGRGARLLEGSGDIDSAVKLFCESQEWDEAERLIVTHTPALLARGRWKTFDEWIGGLPAGRLESSAWLTYWTGMSRVAIEPTAARKHLEEAYSKFLSEGDTIGQLMSASATSQAIYIEAAEFAALDRCLKIIEELLQRNVTFPSPAAELQVFSGMLIAITFRAPAHSLAPRCVERILALMVELIDANQRLTAAGALILYAFYSGALELGRRLEALVQPVLNAPELTARNAAFWYCYLGFLSVADNTPEHGHVMLAKAEEIAEREGFPYVLTVCYAGRSALIRVGDALSWLARIEPTVRSARPYDYAHYLGNMLSRAADKGDWALAVEYGEKTFEYLKHTGTVFQKLVWKIPMAWALAELGRYDEARSQLQENRALIEFTEAHCYDALSLLTEANISRCEGDRQQYLDLLRRAFALSRRDFATGRYALRAPIAGTQRLCADALENGLEPDTVRRFIHECPLTPPPNAPESWPWPVKVYTLGRFQVLVERKALEFSHKSPRKTLSLLKVLIAFGGRDVPQQRLVDAVWPDEEGDAAERAFEVTLHRLRKLLGSQDAILVENRSVSVNENIVWTDLRSFENLTHRMFSRADEHEAIPSEAERAFILYQGAFLSADPDAPWAVSQRERSRSRFIQLVTEICRHLEDHARWDDAVRWYLRGLDVDDLTESFYQGLMRCYLAQRRYSEGMNVFRRMRQTLSVTLGITPSPDSQRLLQALQSR